MKAYFARRRADGLFLGKGRSDYHSKFDDKYFPEYWTRMGNLMGCVTSKNKYGKTYRSNSGFIPIDLVGDYDIIELDIGAVLKAEVEKLEAIEKALLFGDTNESK